MQYGTALLQACGCLNCKLPFTHLLQLWLQGPFSVYEQRKDGYSRPGTVPVRPESSAFCSTPPADGVISRVAHSSASLASGK